jgi:ubiquinone/menaquinone biosynthesis C-methylase UbiE
LNFAHYPADADVLATEPDPYMLARARKARSRARTGIELRRAGAESLPLPDRSADVLVCTLVLCSVPDADAVLAEARRVLRSGGALLFLEHVRSSDPDVAASQDRWDRRWARFAGGCHPNRDSWSAIQRAGFEEDDVDRTDLPGVRFLRPAVSGVVRAP